MNQEQTNITTGKQIRHLRTQLGMTQEELAGELNVTRQALSNWILRAAMEIILRILHREALRSSLLITAKK